MATALDDSTVASADAARERSVGEHIFIWIAWALAAAFWGATLATFIGILRGITTPGVGYLLVVVVGGLVLLGLAMALGSFMVARRNRRLDPVTEAGTAALYDQADRQISEEMAGAAPKPGGATRNST
jgi:hypothetical protein